MPVGSPHGSRPFGAGAGSACQDNFSVLYQTATSRSRHPDLIDVADARTVRRAVVRSACHDLVAGRWAGGACAGAGRVRPVARAQWVDAAVTAARSVLVV